MDFTILSNLLYDLFVNDIFGSKQLFAFAIITLIGYISLRMRVGFTVLSVVLISAFILFAGMGFINLWVVFIIIFLILLVIAFGMLRVGRR